MVPHVGTEDGHLQVDWLPRLLQGAGAYLPELDGVVPGARHQHWRGVGRGEAPDPAFVGVGELHPGPGDPLHHVVNVPDVDPSVSGARHHQVPDDLDTVHARVVGVGADRGCDGVCPPECLLLLPGDAGLGPVDVSWDSGVLPGPSSTQSELPSRLVSADAQELGAHTGQDLHNEPDVQELEDMQEDLRRK